MFRSILGRVPPGVPQSFLPSLVAKKEEPIVKTSEASSTEEIQSA